MKIINAMFSKVNGGLEQSFLNYTPALTMQGNQVIQVIHPESEIKDSCPKGQLILVHNYNQYDPFAIRKLRKLIQSEEPQAIITHSYRAAYLFKKTKTKVPRIAVCHVRSQYDFGADAIIALTDSMRNDIIQAGHPEHTVFTVPNMISIPEGLNYHPPKPSEIPVIGACARFSDIKGIDVFIEALALLKKRNIAFKANIAGDGKEKERYINLIQHHQLQQEITLLGWINDKQAFYNGIDLFCLPSREESFGLVILESMMHSVPMVLTELSGPLEIMGNTESALLVPPSDPVSMANALERLIKDNALAKLVSLNAFERVHYYSNQNIGPILQNVLNTICRPGY